MITTVKDAEKRINELQAQYDDFMKLQNYALGLDLPKRHKNGSQDALVYKLTIEKLQKIKEEAHIDYDIRTLCTIGCNLCKAEIQRIQTIIDNSKINI